MDSLFVVVALTLLVKPMASAEVTFSYSGSTGPDQWASLSPNYTLCSTGKSQSPVNLFGRLTPVNPNLKALDIQFSDSVNATLVNKGYHVELSYNGGGGVLVLNGTNYTLNEMHWHVPSEHQFFRIPFAGEVHLGYSSPNNSAALVAIMLRLGRSDPILAKLEEELSGLPVRSAGQSPPEVAVGNTTDIQNLLREFTNTDRYYTYQGSATTPPCTEGVTDIVIGEFRTISIDQVEALKRPLDNGSKNNARPVQPLNGRKVEAYQSQ
ncbi:unnamed protein product [Cuscuta epithymum]|uniref:Alpha-carbonic anhydrase domain-containing protein n=1 Tax=Cuscuta epithymum TaxID=186058 RepID=A0AAV0CND0_9ASTE|nr:unnamed protein product [Cuscuta epithymum]